MPTTPTMPDASPQGSLDSLSAALWRERALADRLLAALGREHAALSADPVGWVGGGEGDLPEQLRVAGLLRAVAVEAVAVRVGLPPGATLQMLADASPDPWPLILEGHRDGLRVTVAAIQRDVALIGEALVRAGRSPSDLGRVGVSSLADLLR